MITHECSELDGKLRELSESPGEVFHPDSDDKLKELAECYSFSEPCDWVLKVVQAAVQSGAKELQIHQSSTELIFEFNAQGWDDIALEESFF